MIKIAIDLSTTQTGVAVLDENNTLMMCFNINFRTYQDGNLYNNFKLIKNNVSFFKKYLDEEIIVGIELSNFGNSKITNRFHLYAGAFITYFYECGIKNIKFFPSTAWQHMIGLNSTHTREMTKKRAREFMKDNCNEYQKDWSEDICDAYCIAYHLDKIKSTEQIANNKKIKNKFNKSVKNEIINLQKMINARLTKINKLDKIKNKKLITRLDKEIEFYRNKIKGLKNV